MRFRPILLLLAAFLVLPGCIWQSSPFLSPDQDFVSYETITGPFCGRCDTTKITVALDGRVLIEQGYWAGQYQNWRKKRREVQVSQEVLSRFLKRLETYRPEGELALNNEHTCKSYMTDTGGLHIVWHDQSGDDQLRYEFGCDARAQAEMRKALSTAPKLLEIPSIQIPEFGM